MACSVTHRSPRGNCATVPIPSFRINLCTMAPLCDSSFLRTEIPAMILSATAADRSQDLTNAIVTLSLYEATTQPRVLLGTWDNDSATDDYDLSILHLDRSRLEFQAIVDFSTLVPSLEPGTRSIEYEVFIAFQGQKRRLDSGRFTVV